MTETTSKSRLAEIIARQPAMKEAHEQANREALLEHARMGRSVCESRDGKVVWIEPKEIFARYGMTDPDAPDDRPARPWWRGPIIWGLIVSIALVAYELTAQPALAVVTVSLKMG
jgi:hypothetical protein